MKSRSLYLSIITSAMLIPLLVLSLSAVEPPDTAVTGSELDAAHLLGSELQLSNPSDPEAERYVPDIAYNGRHREYLVVWHNTWPGNHRDVYARRVSASGELLSWFAVSSGPNDRFQPAVAYNALNDEYLIVWMYDVNGNGSKYEIWGRIVAWNGAYQKPEFRIITWQDRSFWSPDVAWNGIHNEYMVIWSALDTSGGQPGVPKDVSSMVIGADGSIIHGAILTTSTNPSQAAITYNLAKDEYFVVFVRSYSQMATGDDIYGLRVNWKSEVLIPPGAIPIANSNINESRPAVDTNGQDRYITAWQEGHQGGKQTFAARQLDANGQPGQAWVSPDNADQQEPSVAAEFGPAGNYLAVWQQKTPSGVAIKGARFGPTVVPYQFMVADYTFWDLERPSVAAGSPEFFIAYEGDTTGDPAIHRHIYGRTWTPQGLYLPVVIAGQ